MILAYQLSNTVDFVTAISMSDKAMMVEILCCGERSIPYVLKRKNFPNKFLI